MKTNRNKCFCVLLVLLLCLGCCSYAFGVNESVGKLDETDFLHTEGTKIVNEKGEQILLRGTNFGGWGIMEDWFCPYTSPAGEEVMFQKLVERFGTEKTHALMQHFRSNWITAQDYRNVAELGMNVVRLPIWFRNFQSDDNGTWYRTENGEIDWRELDEAIACCRQNGLYIIIDLHGLPGCQNDYDHSGHSKSMHLFDETPQGERYRAVAKEFWVALASRYKDEPAVAMFDLMNEPLGTSANLSKTNYRQIFFDYSNELYQAVRAVDSRHIISMEAIWSPDAIPSPEVYGWENIVYQEHLYDMSNPTVLKKVNEIRDANYEAPFLIGEFYPRGASTFGYIFSLFNSRELSWTTWTYKGAAPLADHSPWFLFGSSKIKKIDFENDSYETLWEKCGEVLRTDGGAFRRTAFADYVKNFVHGEIDTASLRTFGAVETRGTLRERAAMFGDKLLAIVTTLRDWARKLKTGDLL